MVRAFRLDFRALAVGPSRRCSPVGTVTGSKVVLRGVPKAALTPCRLAKDRSSICDQRWRGGLGVPVLGQSASLAALTSAARRESPGWRARRDGGARSGG